MPTPAELIKLYGDKAIIYGTSSLALKDKVGYVKSCTIDGDLPDFTVKGESDEVVTHGVNVANIKREATVVATIKTDVATPPKEGDSFKIGDKMSGIILHVTLNYKSNDAAEYTLKVSGYANINYEGA